MLRESWCNLNVVVAKLNWKFPLDLFLKDHQGLHSHTYKTQGKERKEKKKKAEWASPKFGVYLIFQ